MAHRVVTSTHVKNLLQHSLKSRTLTPMQIGSLFQVLDTNRDNVLSRQEVVQGAKMLNMTTSDAHSLFDRLDINNDGVISRAEFSVIEEPSIMSSLQQFLSTNLEKIHHTKPLGRWTLDYDNFEKSYAYDHSA